MISPIFRFFLTIWIIALCTNLQSQSVSESEKPGPSPYLIPGNEQFQLSGYFQIEGYAENSGPGNIATENHEDGIRIRRARLSADGNLLSSLFYKIQMNGNIEGVNIEDAYALFGAFPFLDIKFGRFTKPFGLEIYKPSKQLDFAERSRYWSYILNEKKSNGLEFTLKLGNSGQFSWSNALFYEYTNGFTSVRRQDLFSRIFVNDQGFIAGAAFNLGVKKFKGIVEQNDYKAGLFTGYEQKNWKLNAEGAIFLRESEITPAGYGAHMEFVYLFNPHWQMGHRISYTSLTEQNSPGNYHEAKEIGFSNIIPDKPEWMSIDYTVDISYFIFSQISKTSNLSKVSLEYSPSYHFESNIFAHSFYVELQVCF